MKAEPNTNGEGRAKEFRIDFLALQRIMHIGVRRAAGFMLLGLSAAENQEVGKAAFDPENNKFRMRYFPELMSKEAIADVQENFKQWVIESGLRELDQHCSIYCDRIYEILVLLEYNNKRIPQIAVDRIRFFQNRTSVGGKLQALGVEFGIVAKYGDHISSMTLARNCLTHNMGRVSHRNANSKEGLMLSWLVMNTFVGEVMLTDDMLPYHVEKDEVMSIRFDVNRRLVKFGEAINLQAHELLEICWNYESQTDQIAKDVEQLVKERGIHVPESHTE
jgi:hypothetical protein